MTENDYLTRLEFLLGKQAPYLAVSLVNLALLVAMNRWLFGVPFKGSGLTLALGGLLGRVLSMGGRMMGRMVTNLGWRTECR